MSTDQQSSNILAEPPVVAAIDNELPTYRAISPRAIISVLCGVLGLLSLAHPFFYLFAVLAVVLGLTADRNIQRFPDMLTGRGLAKAGVFMGLVFGLGILTVTTVQAMIRTRNASEFARHLADVAKSGTYADLTWYGIAPPQRKGVTAEDIMDKMKKSSKQDAMMMDMKNAPLKKLKDRLDLSKEQEIHFERIENEGSEGMINVALALYEVHGPTTKQFPEAHEHALAIIKGMNHEGRLEWWVDDVRYPYKPKSADLPEAPVADDGHGHAH